MALLSGKRQRKPHRCRLGQAMAIYNSSFRITAEIMKRIDFTDPLFLQKGGAHFSARSNFFRGLENKIHIAAKGLASQSH